MAEELFQKKGLTNLSAETRMVIDFIKVLPNNLKFEDPDQLIVGKYQPPKSQERAVVRVNKYVLKGLDKDKLSPRDKSGISALISYMHTYRFLHQINTYNERKKIQIILDRQFLYKDRKSVV